MHILNIVLDTCLYKWHLQSYRSSLSPDLNFLKSQTASTSETTLKRVKFALPLAALAMAASVAAAPAPAEASPAVSGTNFSFEAWVEDIIAHPDTALTVDEALAAAEAADVVGSAGGLQKRAVCDGSGWTRANVRFLPR